MEEDGGQSSSPFWVPKNTASHRRHRFESAVFSSGILVFLLLVAAVFFLVFIVPKTINFTSSVFRPSSVKKSWDSVNVVLVFLAIIFGILSRGGKNESQKSNPNTPVRYTYRDEVQRSNPSAFDRWVESSDRRSFNGGGLRRSFSSYPDLCEMSPRWVSADYQWRFYDDTRVDGSRVYDSGHLFRRRSWREVDRIPEAESNRNASLTPAPSSPPQPPPPPPAAAATVPPEPVYEDKDKITYESVGHKRKARARKKRDHGDETKKSMTPPPPAASPPPPPLRHYVEPKSSKSERKRSSTSATKGFIISSLYHKRKRKHRSQSVDNLDALIHTSQPPPLHFQLHPPSPPPPPPPPPPPSVFHNLFSSKKSKRKKNVAPPPPPPPPPATANPWRTSRPNPAGVSTVNRRRAGEERSVEIVEEKPNLGGETPLIPIPPPPPPPPFFKKTAWKFVVQGDYVRVDSLVSSRSESPDPEDLDSDVTPTAAEGGGDRTPFPPSPLFCPSPDVNTKAENFISKFRAGLKLEKINSMKRLGLSNLGPTQELC